MKYTAITISLAAVLCCPAPAELPDNPTTPQDYYAVQDEVVSALNQLAAILQGVKDKAAADAAAPAVNDLAANVERAVQLIMAKQEEVQKILEQRQDFTPAQYDDALFTVIKVNSELKVREYYHSTALAAAMESFTRAITGRGE
ncbi:MAG: hypothetical protein Q4C88_09710 [Akkermansia sp.]|nr:hypothetical protein [Akkermansia sp.]